MFFKIKISCSLTHSLFTIYSFHLSILFSSIVTPELDHEYDTLGINLERNSVDDIFSRNRTNSIVGKYLIDTFTAGTSQRRDTSGIVYSA